MKINNLPLIVQVVLLELPSHYWWAADHLREISYLGPLSSAFSGSPCTKNRAAEHWVTGSIIEQQVILAKLFIKAVHLHLLLFTLKPILNNYTLK